MGRLCRAPGAQRKILKTLILNFSENIHGLWQNWKKQSDMEIPINNYECWKLDFHSIAYFECQKWLKNQNFDKPYISRTAWSWKLKFSAVFQCMNMKLWLKFQENLRLHVSKVIFSEGFYKKWLLKCFRERVYFMDLHKLFFFRLLL